MQTLLENDKIHVERFICENIDATHLRKEYVTWLGPRQVSKTTLSKRHYEAKLGGLCRDLEKSKDRKLLRNAKLEGKHAKTTNFQRRSAPNCSIQADDLPRLLRRILRRSYFATVSIEKKLALVEIFCPTLGLFYPS